MSDIQYKAGEIRVMRGSVTFPSPPLELNNGDKLIILGPMGSYPSGAHPRIWDVSFWGRKFTVPTGWLEFWTISEETWEHINDATR